jgi:hypothetical protein
VKDLEKRDVAVGILVAILVCSVGVVIVIAWDLYASIPVTVRSPPGLSISANATDVYAGDTITFMATLDNQQSDIPIRFYIPAVKDLGIVNTDGSGIATLSYTFSLADVGDFEVWAYATNS